MSARLVALTGATGFLGRRLVGCLNAAGWRVRILARSTPDPTTWEGDAPDVVTGRLEEPAALARLMAGADGVIHAAGLIKARSRRDFFAVNEDGARCVASAAGGRRLVHISSLAAREPGLSDYAASKRAGELAVEAVAKTSTTIVRPPALYGAGDRETLALFKTARGPLVVIPGTARAKFAIAEVDDVARFIVDLIGTRSDLGTVTVGGDRPEGYAWREVVAAAASAVGGHPLVIAAPAWAIKSAGAASEFLGRWRDAPPIFTRGKAAEALHSDWGVSLAEQGLAGGRSYTALAEGFARTVAWYRANGWLR